MFDGLTNCSHTYVNVFFVYYWYCVIVIFQVVVSKLDYVSPVWNNITAIDANNVAALCFTLFYPAHFWPLCLCTWVYEIIYVLYKLEDSNFMLLFYTCFSWFKFCLSFIEDISLRFPSCSTRKFTQFSTACKNCPSSRFVTAANLVCSNIDIFSKPIRS